MSEDDWDDDSGPFCQHWHSPDTCETMCQCGHPCSEHAMDGECNRTTCSCGSFVGDADEDRRREREEQLSSASRERQRLADEAHRKLIREAQSAEGSTRAKLAGISARIQFALPRLKSERRDSAAWAEAIAMLEECVRRAMPERKAKPPDPPKPTHTLKHDANGLWCFTCDRTMTAEEQSVWLLVYR